MSKYTPRIARSIVAILCAGFIQMNFAAPAAFAAPPIEPTISSVTADATSLTVNLQTTGISASSWQYIITRRTVSGCTAASAGDGVVQSTASLVSSITVTGLTSGCYYSVKVAGFNGVIGDYNEVDKLVGGFSSVLNVVYQNDGGTGTGIVRTPFTSGCSSGTLSNINYTIANGSGPSGCNTTYYTGYLSGYIKAPYTGTVTFKMATDDAGVLAIQGNAIAFVTANTAATGTFNMVAGQVYRFEEWFHNDGGMSANAVYWSYTGQAEQIIPAGNFANDPSVLAADGGCTIGMAARCAAGSALEIKQATGTNTDGQYWIMMNGAATLVYCVMNSSQGGGGWMLAMRGKNSSSTFTYDSSYWTNSTLLNNSYPDRFNTTDTIRNTDAKYSPFAYATGNQVMVLYPEVTTLAGGAFGTNGSANASGVNGTSYGFAWHETFTAGTAWTGSSNGFNPATYQGGGTTSPAATSNCVNSANTLVYLFSNASRCAFRQVQSNYNSSETPYSAVGNNVFFSQTDIRFFGINYGNASTSFITKSRIGFGWNENGTTNEDSNDGNGGIGLYSTETTTVAAGTINGCCSSTNHLNAGQTGLTTSDHTARALGYELYVRNATSATVSGRNLRVTYKRNSSLTAGSGYFASGTNGSNTFRISPLREGISMDSSNGVITVSENVAIGTYYETVTVVDSAGVSAARSITIQVVADSSETDSALSFDGTQSLSTTGTIGLWSDQTWEFWVKPTNTCSGAGNQTVLGTGNFIIFCNSSDWWLSWQDSGGNWKGYKTSLRVVQNEWVHLAVVRSGSNISMFANNKQLKIYVSSAWVDSYSQTIRSEYPSIVLGGSGGAGQYFTGVIDEVKIWSEVRTIEQIWNGAHTAENLGSFGLLMYWDFNEGTGSAISRGQRADGSFNFTPVNTNQWVPVATTTPTGPYTVVLVPRTLINKVGGWRAPDSITALTALVLGGGGGGGGGYQGGGGGAGGFLENTVTVDPKNIYPIRVGVGGLGTSNPASPSSGDSSTAFGYAAIGGGAGGAELVIAGSGYGIAHAPGGSGGGGGWSSGGTGSAGTAGQGFAGGDAPDFSSPVCTPSQYAAAGGGGASGKGFSPTCSKGGNGGAPKLSTVTGTYVAGGGGGSIRSANATSHIGYGSNNSVSNGGNSGYISGALVGATGGATNGAPGTGTGGGAGMSSDGATGYGGAGGSGIVTFRYITNQKPTFTQPKNAYLNAGMTETFSVNVAADSETAMLTRTFRWESSTTGSAGTFSLIKEGTGAANASFSWVPPDTATSGNQFVYRVIVTDSDTAGLFIVDTSTAVFATINKALVLNSKSTLTKTVNISKTETFTVSDGTPTYRYTLTPASANFWLDTSTVGSPRIKFADTVTAGTYYETFTVTDSVTASIVVPLTITVSPPPSFSASAAQVDSATVLYLDAGNTTSYPRTGTTWSDISGRALSANMTQTFNGTQIAADGSTRTGATMTTNCAAPGYSTEALGSITFNGSGQCAYASNVGVHETYTVELWVKRNGPQTSWESTILTTPYRFASDPINISIFWSDTATLIAGVYQSGSNWKYTTGFYIEDGVWTHISVTLTGSSLRVLKNSNAGSAQTVDTTYTTWNKSIMDNGLLIGQRWGGAASTATWFKGSVASLRIYSRVLTDAELLQNYNATKGRFLQTQNKQAPVGKYGTTVNETYTVTGGTETITATFTASALAGLKWDTTTARSIKLQFQETLSAGTYYDTVTVVDIYGSSTNLPLKFVISKADTLTVYIDTPTALNYTGSPGYFTPVVKAIGLVSGDTDTAVTTINYKPGGLTCATGGTCVVGDIGPGGGVVFITPSTSGGNGNFFEVAPANWIGPDDTYSAAKYCSSDSINTGSTNVGIGWGETNTAYAKDQCMGGAVQLVDTFNQSNTTGYSDWFIPSTNELIELAKVRDQAGLVKVGSAWTVGRYGYWSSTEADASVQQSLVTSSWTMGGTNKSDSVNNMVRPVRQFTPCWGIDSCTSLSSLTAPRDAGSYLITPSGFSIAVGTLDNYENVVYSSTRLTINRVAQSAQAIPFYSPNFPETMTVYTGGGSGVGAQTFTVISSGGSNTCTFDYRKLTTTAAGSCTISVVKQGDRNYLPDTATATILIAVFINNQPAPIAGTGPNIALSGATSITVDPNVAPSIINVTFMNYCSFNGCDNHYEISGEGFGDAYNTDTVVKFWRNKVVTLGGAGSRNFVFSDSVIIINDLPAGWTVGKILVITANGIAVSPEVFTGTH